MIPQDLFAKHRALLDEAVEATGKRAYWSPFPEAPSQRIYGETAAADGEVAFQARLGNAALADQAAKIEMTASDEMSPFGLTLDTRYPLLDIDRSIDRAKDSAVAWRKAGPEGRIGVCIEILQRLNRRSFEMAHATMHTTGQAFVMAFQAGGPHAQDRGLEAVAYSWKAMTDQTAGTRWEKPQGKNPPVVMDKWFEIAGRGVGLVIGCATFPTWNSYPGLFASLAAGNPVLVKPHPAAVMPLAITVEVARDVLRDCGFDPDLVQLFVDRADAPIGKSLALHPDIRLIDFTGSSAFGDWLEHHARQAVVFTEKAGVNTVIIDSTDDFNGMTRNLALSLSLYSGQMCTTPQVIFIPRGGIATEAGSISCEAVEAAIVAAVERLLADPERAGDVLGAIQSPATLERLDAAAGLGNVLLPSRAAAHPKYPEARIRTPLILSLNGEAEDQYGREWFGPITMLVRVADTAEALDRAKRLNGKAGALTASLYSVDPVICDAAEEVFIASGTALSVNLTGPILVNQSAAFSDFHGTGANPAANAALCDPAFVASRFRVIPRRRYVPTPLSA